MFHLFGMDSASNEVVRSINDFKKNYSLNTGNLLFNFGCRKIADLSLEKVSWGASKKYVNSKCNGLLIPMANQLGGHIDLSIHGPKLDGIDLPVAALGLGAQFEEGNVDINLIPEGTIRWLTTLSGKGAAKNIGVRGQCTASILSELGFGDHVEVLGCPSLFINNNPSLGTDIKKKWNSSDLLTKEKAISILAGNPFLNKHSTLERSLIEWVDVYNAEYVIQHPQLLIELANQWEYDKTNFNVLVKRWFPTRSAEDVLEWFSKNSKVYISVPQWLLEFSNKEICIGTRIHGIQAAIQSGTPAICLYVDTRTKELCEEMHIPHADAKLYSDGINLEQACDILHEWDWDRFDENRLLLAKKTHAFLLSNGVNPTPDFNKMIA